MTTDGATILGPFLCRATDRSMGFWFCFGADISVSVSVTIQGEGRPPVTVEVPRLAESQLGAYLGESRPELQPATAYTYSVQVNGKDWLPPGLSPADLHFRTLPRDEDCGRDFEFVLLSCHGVEAYEAHAKRQLKSAEHTWRMWSQLEAALASRKHCYLGVLGGDQVYMDDTFGDRLQHFDPADAAGARQNALAVYRKYWGNETYRRIMARLPCVMMWDDHDLIDGWGSREEAYAWRTRRKDKWQAFGQLQRQVFWEMQACRNPTGLDTRTHTERGYSHVRSLGPLAFFALDLRSGRQLRPEARMLDPEHQALLTKAFATLGERRHLFLISPVTVARMGGGLEQAIGGLANFFWDLTSWVGYGAPKRRAAIWGLTFGILYFFLHIQTPSSPAFFHALCALVASIFVLSERHDLKRYLPRARKWILRGAWAVLAFALLQLLYPAIITHSNTLHFKSLALEIETGLCNKPGDKLFNIGLAYVALAAFAWPKGTKWRKRVFLIAFAFLALFLAQTWQLGLPDKAFSPPWITTLLGTVAVLVTFISLFMAALEMVGAIDDISGIDDDVRDGWSSESNLASLTWLAEQVKVCLARGVERVTFLCGDIHTGGLSLVTFGEGNGAPRCHQITSSPMTYYPMPAMVERLTTATDVIRLGTKKEVVGTAQNLFFRSERNFAVVGVKGDRLAVDYYFEDMPDRPLSVEI